MRLLLAAAEDMPAAVRGADAASVVVRLPAGMAAAEIAVARATVELLAVERAPRVRVNAVIAAATAAPADVEAALAFLERAASTTGQVIEIG